MRITFICKRFYTNRDLIDDQFGRLFHIPAQLARLGHHVGVIALDYRRGRPRKEQIIAGVTFVSLPLSSATNLISVISRLKSEVDKENPDVLIASGDIYIGALAAIMARKRPWLFDVYDDYRYFASAKIPGMKMLFRQLLGKASHVIVASRPLASRLSSYARRISVVENGIDPLVFHPLDKGECRRSLNIDQDETVIGYFGSITSERGIDILLQAFAHLYSISRDTRLLLAGCARDEASLNSPGIDFRGVVNQDKIPALIAACDVAVIPYVNDPMINATNACKIAEYLACAIPVVVTRVSNMAEMFSETPEVIAEAGNVQSLVQVISLQLEKRIISPLPTGIVWADLAKHVEKMLIDVCGQEAVRPPHPGSM